MLSLILVIGFAVMLTTTAYLTRGLQLLLGTSKRAIVERAEEMGAEDDSIPLTHSARDGATTSQAPSAVSLDTDIRNESLGQDISVPSPSQDPSQIRGTGGPPPQDPPTTEPTSPPNPRQSPLPLTRTQRWAAFINLNLDTLTYALIFLFAGLPIYYLHNYAMPLQLSLNVLAYFAALALPATYKRFLHPVLVSSALTILGIYLLALTHGHTLHDALHAYSTKTRYLQLFTPHKPPHPLPLPGAGDLFSTLLDASIVALALPMFHYRHDLTRHFLALTLPNLLLPTASLFAYPPLCHALGISPQRSLAFAARSLTLALATPATRNLGGDLNLVAVLCIMSGILGVLVGPWALRKLLIPEDDYVTRGVALGGNSSAIATALLLGRDPRAAALSCLSMSVFGTVMVGLTSVPAVVRVVGGLVGTEKV